MTDAEGIRNLVGTGLVQLAGGLLTASIALAVLFYLNWRLTSVTLLILVLFGVTMAVSFSETAPGLPGAGEDQRGGDRSGLRRRSAASAS